MLALMASSQPRIAQRLWALRGSVCRGTSLRTQTLTLPFKEERLGQGLAREVGSDSRHCFAATQVHCAAIQDERERLARELHDGVLQALTGAALQLEALSRLVEVDPLAARQRLRNIEELITEEQRELRSWIQKLRPTPAISRVSEVDLSAALEKLCQRAQRDWGLQVVLTAGDHESAPRTLWPEIYRIVQEALNNVGRHALAAIARVELRTTRDRVYITVTDDGRGFPFRGRFDLVGLVDGHMGPVSLKERVAYLGGDLVLTSTHTGSRLEVTLPVDQRPTLGGVSLDRHISAP